jgi:hypothetical protein
MNPLAEIVDVFFNRRPLRDGERAPAKATAKRPAVTVGELVKRGTSVVLYEGKLYRIVVEEAEVVKK